MTSNNPKIKETQGHRKLQQYVDDLKRNKHLLAKIKKIKAIMKRPANTEMWDRQEARINELVEKTNEQVKIAMEDLNELKLETDEIIYEIAEEYGLDSQMVGNFFLFPEIMGNEKDSLSLFYDFCTITDDYDERVSPLSPDFPYPPSLPLAADVDKQAHIRAFPISINIHKFATKRDVLDFIEKNWQNIEGYLEIYRNYKKIRFRARKHTREITDFIWKNRNLSLKEIKNRLDKAHPKNGLVYYEIGKIISIEKRRRLRKITVGQ